MINKVGRSLPEQIEHYGKVTPYAGAFATQKDGVKTGARLKSFKRGEKKLLSGIREAIEKSGLRDGMTVSFHHHMRNGDKVVNLVMQEIAAMGIKDIRLAASGIFECHAPLVELIENGVITQTVTNTFNPGPVAKAITAGKLAKPAIFMTHGGRPRAIESGDLHIDVAFVSAPTCDEQGNMNGTKGKSACGYLSYSYLDAQYADSVVAVTDTLVPYPNCPIEITSEFVDYVVVVDSIGDPGGIVSKTLKVKTDPVSLQIASNAANLADAAGYIKDGMSFQTGASGASLAAAALVRDMMKERGIKGSFGLGGIHSYFVQMLEEGLFKALFDTQCFDLVAVESAGKNENHMAISASLYANPHNRGAIVNYLDTVLLGATEIDVDFNVNVITGSNGVIMGASGGHSDTAAGSKLTIVVANLTRKAICVVREKVTTVTTPGETIDAFVTEHGIAINPLRKDLLEAVKDSGLPIVDIRELKAKGEEIAGPQVAQEFTDKLIGVVEYRDGTVIDLVYQPKGYEFQQQ
ncbi:MAG: citrate lyase subunit alpha [Oscillospiraceae bacterium]|nr:citrate lyase subunit alpha [Oscillospiraceae bacterium]